MSHAKAALDSLSFHEGCYAGEIYFPWIDMNCSFVLEEFLGDVPNENCLPEIQAFLDWDDSLQEKLEEASRRYALHICRERNQDSTRYVSAELIGEHCFPMEVSLQILDQGSIVIVELDCDWEIEHGMGWLVQSGKSVAYVGPFDGANLPFALAHPNEPMNFAGNKQ